MNEWALFPPPTDFLVLQALFTIAMVSKIIRAKDLGQGNLGVRELRPGEPGALPEVVVLDCNSWEPYGAGQWPGFPNKARAGGFWNMVQQHDPHLKEALSKLVEANHSSLEDLTCALRAFARGRLEAEVFEDLMHILVQTQVLGITPEGRLAQPLLPDNQRHDLVPGKVWLLKPFPAEGKGLRGSGARQAQHSQ